MRKPSASPHITPPTREPVSRGRRSRALSQQRRRFFSYPRSLSNWARLVSGALLIFVTLLAVVLACAVSIFRIGFTPVLTNSMSPTFQQGSVVITRPKDTEALKVGDVAILPLPGCNGQQYLHRLIDVQRVGTMTLVKTQGDHNPLPDAWTLEVTSSHAPVAVGSIPYVGWMTNVMRGTPIRFGFAGGIVILVVVGFKRLRREFALRGDRGSTSVASTH